MNAWYEISDRDSFLKSVNERADFLMGEMEHVQTQAGIYQNYYDNILSNYTTARSGRSSTLAKGRLSYNVITGVVDNGFNRLAKVKPKPTFTKPGIAFFNKSQVKKIDMFTLKNMKKNNFYPNMTKTLKCGLIQNVGFHKTFPNIEKGTVESFFVPVHNIGLERPYERTDEFDEIVEIQVYSIWDIIEKFILTGVMEEEEADIFLKKNSVNCKSKDLKDKLHEINPSNDISIEVKEIYKAGRKRAIVTEDAIICKEDWKYDFTPYDNLGASIVMEGIVTVGWVELLTGIQRRINTLLAKISKSIDTSMFPVVLAHISAQVQNQYTDEVGNVILWEGIHKPETTVAPVTHPQVFQHLYHMIEMAYKTLRLTEERVTEGVPGGINQGSGIAVQNVETVENAKFYSLMETYENFAVNIAKKIAKYGYEENLSGLKEELPNFREWMDDIETYPTSIFPYTPEGKIARAETMVNLGLYNLDEIADVYDFPEANRLLSSKSARVSSIWYMLEQALYNQENIQPDPVLGYNEQNEVALKIYAGLKQMENTEKERDIILKFLEVVGEELKRIEIERIQAVLQNNQPTETAPPEAPGNPSNQDQEGLAESGTGISAENQQSII